MAGRISPELKDQILARTEILDIIGERVVLKQAGQDYVARCPFHQEKTPSFTVSPTKQFYHCFGCGAHGDAIGFLMEYDRLNFPEAIGMLAARAGIALPEAGTHEEAAQIDNTPVYQALEAAAALYQQQLRGHAEAVAYLKGRGLSGEIAAEFGLGFAPPGWDFLLSRFGGDAVARQALIDAGLVIEREHGEETRRYDRFRNRLMFPIRDERGRVVAFGGRVLDRSEPKYLNSPETAVFHKGSEVYGLFEACQRQRRNAQLIVVEGYMDAIALSQFGIPGAVATLGTATTNAQLLRLKRHAEELVFCFDGDSAGRAAAWKALRLSLPLVDERLRLRFLLLPTGQDPDSLLREAGAQAFTARLEQALLLSDYLFQELAARSDLKSAEGQARCDAEARALIAQVPEGTYRQLLLQRLEDLVGIQRSPAAGGQVDARASASASFLPGLRALPRRVSRGRLSPLRLAIALLLRNPRLVLAARAVPDGWMDLTEEGTGLLSELLAYADADPDIAPARLREAASASAHEQVLAELSDPNLIRHIPDAGIEAEFTDALSKLCREAESERRYRLLRSGQLERLAADGGSVLPLQVRTGG